MRHYTILSVLITLLILPGLAVAGTLVNVVGSADCDAWSADLTISFRSSARLARVEYVVLLQDDTGAEVERFDYADFIDIPEASTAVFTYGANWSTTPGTGYKVTGDFTVYDIIDGDFNTSAGSFSFASICGGTTRGPTCLHRASYWAEHPAEWPVAGLEIAGQTQSQSELMAMLERRGQGQPHLRLARQLVAAKLNLANGGSDVIQAVVGDADDLLAGRPANRRDQSRWIRGAVKLTLQLFRYNRSGCEEETAGSLTLPLSGASTESADKLDDAEAMSLGSLKAMYR